MEDVDLVLRRHIQPSSAKDFSGMQQHALAIDDTLDIAAHPHIIVFHTKKLGQLSIEEAAEIVYPLPNTAHENFSVTPADVDVILTGSRSRAVVLNFTEDSIKECRDEQTHYLDKVQKHTSKDSMYILRSQLCLVLGYTRNLSAIDRLRDDLSQSKPDRINLQTLNVGPVALRQAMLRAKQLQKQRSFFASLQRPAAN